MAHLKRSTGTIVKSTVAELNILDGVTSTAAELNIMDGVTSTAAELNIVDGVTSTAAELNLLDGKTGIPDEVVLQRKFSKTNQQGHLSFQGSSGWTRHPKYSEVEFSYTPKSTTSKLVLEYSYGIVHGSTNGGYGWYAFTKAGERNQWVNGGGQTGYTDSYGHGASGKNENSGGYQGVHLCYWSENNSTSAFDIGIHVKWAGNNWFYAHDGAYHILSITEILN